MRVAKSPNFTERAARWGAGLLAIFMAVSPLAAQNSPAPATPAASTGATTHKKSSKTTPATRKAGARSRHATRPGHAARAARTARIKQAFVASTELRPMAQQLALLRPPAAYGGGTGYA